MIPRLVKLQPRDLRPLLARSIPAAERAHAEAVAHLGGAPVPQRWDIDRSAVTS